MNIKPQRFTKPKRLNLTPEQSEFLTQEIAPKYHGGYSEFIRLLIDKEMALSAKTL